MRVPSCLLVLALLPALSWGTACSGRDDTRPQASEASPPPNVDERGSRTLPIPDAPAPGLPAEPAPHGAPQPAQPPGELLWDVPEGWVPERPISGMRRAQYRVPGDAGDGECVVFYFGRGQGGDPLSNASRWAGQFTQPDGSSSLDRMETTRLESGRVPVYIVEVTGTYDGGMTMTDAPAQAKPGYMLLGAIAEGPDAPWFFKLTGPEATVRAHRPGFVRMMESMRPGS